jgi:SAM-dependent methyltransferase
MNLTFYAVTQRFARACAALPVAARCQCTLCERRVRQFLPYRGGWRAAPPLMRALQIVGSDLDHYLCPRCGSTDRERHLWLYLQAAGLLEAMRGRSVLQFAPEPGLMARMDAVGCARLVRADLFPNGPGIERIDMLAIPYADETFDFVLANHVLEHVADDRRALAELRRVLKPGGGAILQTPYSAVLQQTIADPGVTTAEARLQLYGQEDHVRLYGRDIGERFAAAGFVSRMKTHAEALPEIDAVRCGVNRAEPFLWFERG